MVSNSDALIVAAWISILRSSMCRIIAICGRLYTGGRCERITRKNKGILVRADCQLTLLQMNNKNRPMCQRKLASSPSIIWKDENTRLNDHTLDIFWTWNLIKT
jgi:hypothetical protein